MSGSGDREISSFALQGKKRVKYFDDDRLFL